MNMIALVLFFPIFFVPLSAWAHTPIQIHVTIGKVTEVVFPQKVAKVIKGGISDSVLVEVLDNSIYILPKTTNPCDIFVTDVSGESYPLNLQLALEHDIRIDLQSSTGPKTVAEGGKLGPLDLMKTILLGQEPAGSTVLQGGQKVVLDNSRIRLTVEKIYDFPHMRAYILKGENLTAEDVVVPIQQIVFPHLLAITADQDLLKAKGETGSITRLYLITAQ